MEYVGLRGDCYVDCPYGRLRRMCIGIGGSIFPNSGGVCVALSSLKDPDEFIRLPGFLRPDQIASLHEPPV